MPFDMSGEVILTCDEHGLRAGDVGTVVELHVVPGGWGRLLGRVLRHDQRYGRRGHAAGQRPPSAHTSGSSGAPRPHRLSVRLPQAACLSESTARSQLTVRFQLVKMRLTSLRSCVTRRLPAGVVA